MEQLQSQLQGKHCCSAAQQGCSPLHLRAGYAQEGWKLMDVGLKTCLQEKAVSGRQHKWGTNLLKEAKYRAQQSLCGQEDTGVVKQADGIWEWLSNGLGFCCRLS